MRFLFISCLVALVAVTGCSDDDSKSNTSEQPDASQTDAGNSDTTSASDTESGASDTSNVAQDTSEASDTQTTEDDTSQESDVEEDVMADTLEEGDTNRVDDTGEGPKDCIQLDPTGDWTLDFNDDVSISYSVVTSSGPQGYRPVLSMLFERYSPLPDTGDFELGLGGPDANFGNCAHCVFMAGANRTRALFADRGTLTARDDPYTRSLDITLTNVRLIEVEVNEATRESTPIPNGVCVEFPEVTATGLFPADGWTCGPELYRDGESCQCECGAFDPDCAPEPDCFPLDPDCEIPEPLPLVDCDADQICRFDPLVFTTACTDTCDWAARTPCASGTCVFNSGGFGEEDICISSEERLDPAVVFGEPCTQNNYQVVCNIVDGFALGYCGPNGTCRSLCETNDECSEEGHTCRIFSGTEGLGYCGPEPEDG